MILKLPSLEFEIKDPSGNLIHHKIHPGAEFNFEVKEEKRSYIVVSGDSVKCCITVNENEVDSDCSYIMLTKRRPTSTSIQTKIDFKRWLKHPMLRTYTPDSISKSWTGAFRFIEEDSSQNLNGLRTPQIGALYAALGHIKIADEIGTIVLPTGTGKTETMLSLLVSNKCKRVLVIVPSDALRKQITEKFEILGHLKKFGIVDDLGINPIVGVLTKKFNNPENLERFFLQCNVIVSTMAIAAGSTPAEIKKMSELCSNLFVDEAHHSKAHDWDEFISIFDKGKVLLFTATPYRNDGQRLEGKIIFNFPLRKAQEQGYFKRIHFLPIREYDPIEADRKIAQAAIQRLREDKMHGYPHILMARCANKKRAEEIFPLYSEFSDLNPIMIHSGVANKNSIIQDIRQKKHSVIICVDMLGEGFDLPELKIAAFHDIRKSLPITLQFAGRFTRTSYDSRLGEACFIANLYQPDVKNEIDELYAQDTDWNLLLPELSTQNVQEQIDFQEFLSGFNKLNNSKIPFQNIRPALSTVVYKNRSTGWNPSNYEIGIPDYDSYDYKFQDYNSDKKTIVILLGKKVEVDWGNFNEVFNIEWNVIIVFWEVRNNLIFIHGSEKTGHYQPLARAILGEDNAQLISGMDVFKVFHNLHRLALFNVGLKKGLGKNLSFQSYYGRSVGDALSILQRKQGIKNNIFGVGYQAGEKLSLGCSQKGRIWSYLRGNIRELTIWCTEIGKKLVNTSIDPDTVLKGTLIPKVITRRPIGVPISIDWDPDVYGAMENRFEFKHQKGMYNLATSELKITSSSESEPLQFSFVTDDFQIPFQLDLHERIENNETIKEFKISKQSTESIAVIYGSVSQEIEAFLNEYVPTIWFADGSSLVGNFYVKIGEDFLPFNSERITSYNWTGVDISVESQRVSPKITNSIQYSFIHSLKELDFDIIYDDDYSGEISDVIAIKNNIDEIDVHLYHLKWAINGVVSNDINNLYEVCGQVQKSVHWKFKEAKELFDHLLRRQIKKRAGQQCSRIEKGSVDELERLLRIAKLQKPIKFYITLVQPAISKKNVSQDILKLLGVTANYLMEVANIELNVIGSD
jgi:superfamily II DNA or RNA helicase